jgi:chromosome partitioning protein
MTRVIAITNQKGGSGKTTTTVNLAAALGEQGRRILLVDLDPQASATTWYGIEGKGKGLYEVFTNARTIAELIQQSEVARVEIIPSSSWLNGIEKVLAGEVGTETILRQELSQLPKRWDYILLDCSPALNILTVNALVAAGEVIVPVESHVLALGGLAQLLGTVQTVKARLNAGLEISGILACRVVSRTRHSQEVIEQLRTRFGNQMYQAIIHESVRLAECPSFGKPITEYDPKGRGAQDYRLLAKEVIAQERSIQAETRQGA